MASCYWYGSRTNNRKLDKLYIVIKSTKCSLHFTSALTDRRTPVDLWCHKFAILVTFNQEKFIIFVNSIYRIQAGTFLELTSETAMYNNLTAKVSVKCIKWFAIFASLKLTDLMILISIFYNVQDHKLDWDTVDTFFNGLSLNYAPLKKTRSCHSRDCAINLETYFISP